MPRLPTHESTWRCSATRSPRWRWYTTGRPRDPAGKDAPPELRRATSLDARRTPAAPPFVIWHTVEDPYVPVEHSYRYVHRSAAS